MAIEALKDTDNDGIRRITRGIFVDLYKEGREGGREGGREEENEEGRGEGTREEGRVQDENCLRTCTCMSVYVIGESRELTKVPRYARSKSSTFFSRAW